MYLPRIKELRRAYGFEEVAIVPGEVTINPELANTTFSLGQHTFPIPFIASAMDGVVDPAMAVKMHDLGGLGVLNIEGVHGRYENPDDILEQISNASNDEITPPLPENLLHAHKRPGRRRLHIPHQGRRSHLRHLRHSPEHQARRPHSRLRRRRHPRRPVHRHHRPARLPAATRASSSRSYVNRSRYPW